MADQHSTSISSDSKWILESNVKRNISSMKCNMPCSFEKQLFLNSSLDLTVLFAA